MTPLLFYGAFLAFVAVCWFGGNALWRWMQSRRFSPLGAAEAKALVWKEYGSTKPCPRVFYVKSPDGGFINSWGIKAYGNAHLGARSVVVGWKADWTFINSALAYELARVHYHDEGKPQYDAPNGSPDEFHNLVARANTVLAQWGLKRGSPV